jgi:hypothetical protein
VVTLQELLMQGFGEKESTRLQLIEKLRRIRHKTHRVGAS